VQLYVDLQEWEEPEVLSSNSGSSGYGILKAEDLLSLLSGNSALKDVLVVFCQRPSAVPLHRE